MYNKFGKHTPKEIKEKVLEQLLYGIPMTAIATYLRIGYGSVYRITESFKSNIPDLAVLRAAVAVKIYNEEGLSLNDIVAGRYYDKNFLEQMGSSELEMERMLIEIDIHSFKTHQNIFWFY